MGSVRMAPLKASPIRNTITMADLPGEWHAGMANARMFYDRYTGAYAGSSTTAYSARYTIAGNGSFTYEMGGVWNDRPVQDKDTGTVQLGGDLIIFKGRNHETEIPLHQFSDGDRRFHGDDGPPRSGGPGEDQCHSSWAAVGARREEVMAWQDTFQKRSYPAETRGLCKFRRAQWGSDALPFGAAFCYL